MPALNTIIRRRIRYGTLCFAKARTFLGCFVLAFLTIYPVSTFAQAQSLVVGVLASPPFVIENNGKFTGLAIDLWEELASENEWQSGYRKYETFRELLDAPEIGRAACR